MNAMSVVKPLAKRYSLYSMRGVIQERHPLYVLSVESPIPTSTVSLPIREFTQERSPISVRIVGNSSMQNPNSVIIRELTQGRNRMNVRIVGNHLCEIKLNIRKCIQGRNLSNAMNVENPAVSQPYMYIKGSIQKRNPINVLSVGNSFATSQP